MARAYWSISVLRHGHGAPLRPAALIRFLSTEPGVDAEKLNSNVSMSEIAKRVCHITRTRPRWEKTLASDFPSFDFSNPVFLQELFKNQSNLLISIRFFYWSLSHYGARLDPGSCELLFDSLVEAQACHAAKSFIAQTGFAPQAASLERYVICLFKGGLVDDAMDAFRRLKKKGLTLKSKTWNVALSACVKAERTGLVWELYKELVASGSLVDMGEETVGHLIRAFCLDGEVSRGYKLLRLVLEDGLVPRPVAFNVLISSYCKRRKFDRVSELLHLMIEKNCTPSLPTYQAVINGLLMRWQQFEALRVFNELKDRGYAPDRIMYATMIHRLCEIGWVWDARKLLYEMISKGFLPEEDTICRMINAFFKVGNVEVARKLFAQLSDKGLGGRTSIYDTMICGLIFHKKIEEAWDLFQEMPQKGIARDYLTYYALIGYFLAEGEKKECRKLCRKLFDEAIAQCLLKEMGDVEGVKVLLEQMKKQRFTPLPLDDLLIWGLCGKGLAAEARDGLVSMRKREIKPRMETFARLLKCLTEGNSVNNSFAVLAFMFKAGCHKVVRRPLIHKLRQGESGLIET
ncbi:hypothetical protein CDL15_Pgr008497 [Punica granatum]|uniref:Pentatricopeptide repeat-containing protein At5g18950 n=1 Tax=Punica granatum TaxID=22663 RepID=A0A218WN18_PUNGR|nr:hypothetical protein CDL15_Pgr008497 [Punica granatum]PKI47992.1 hypothetical protein CRG98_031656 [Punica granatum]